MAVNPAELYDQVSQLSESELDVLANTTRLLLATQETRKARVDEYMRAIELADEITRFVIGQYLKTYVEVDKEMVQRGECGWNEDMTGISHRERVYIVAPHVYWAHKDGYMHDALAKTGEFKSYTDFDDAAEALEFTGRISRSDYRTKFVPQALDTIDHLVHWLAAMYPDSDAAHTVSYYGTPSGRLMHGFHKNYNSKGLLFHESVLEEYVLRECTRTNFENGPHRPVVALVSTGDWDKAVALCSPKKQKKLLG